MFGLFLVCSVTWAVVDLLIRHHSSSVPRRDEEALAALDRERMMVLGTTEIVNWIGLSGAMTNEKMTLVDYVPCYRTPAGTGCAMAFAFWE